MCNDEAYRPHFAQYDLNDEQCHEVKDLVKMLKVFKDITLVITSESEATLHHIVPAFNHLFDYLEQVRDDEGKSAHICLVVEQALVPLSKHYSRTDKCILLFIAVCE